MDASEQLLGRCLCGAVRYRVSAPWLRFVHCHCARCRRATGTGHATNLLAEKDALTWLSGEELLVRYDLPTAKSFATVFCRTCGSPLPHRTRSGSAWVVPAGSLESPPEIRPSAHIYWGSRVPWGCEGDDLPRFEEQIEE